MKDAHRESQSGLTSYRKIVADALALSPQGRLVEAVGLVLEAQGCRAAVGDIFEVRRADGSVLEAEVVGFRSNRVLLMPYGETLNLDGGANLRRTGRSAQAQVGASLLGRVVDGFGRPIDDGPPLLLDEHVALHGNSRNPLRRKPVCDPFYVGVRAIDSLLTMGVGQRIGIFAGGGVGKSSLLGMMVRRAQADVAVIALIGERGREVEEFVHSTLGEARHASTVVVAATSAEPPLVRVRAAHYATAVAEWFAAAGKRVLLVMDSVTRFAMAMREIALAIGEPPTTKGYTPSVFAALPRLLERAGTTSGNGSITGVYSVLVEGDDLSDPIADSVRAILDGHIVLSREQAERGHYPAIDIARSISRVMDRVAPRSTMELAAKVRELIATQSEVSDLVAIGAYKPGNSSRYDAALARTPHLESFLVQRADEEVDQAMSTAALRKLFSEIGS